MTVTPSYVAVTSAISTHTLTWSVTNMRYFGLSRYQISTHTLTWSVTKSDCARYNSLLFQLTRSRGAWRKTEIVHGRNKKFQLTRSRGAWPVRIGDSGTASENFNSHAHVERDIGIGINAAIIYISTHTLTWSVTRSQISLLLILKFQLTRSRGAWHHIF